MNRTVALKLKAVESMHLDNVGGLMTERGSMSGSAEQRRTSDLSRDSMDGPRSKLLYSSSCFPLLSLAGVLTDLFLQHHWTLMVPRERAREQQSRLLPVLTPRTPFLR